MVTKIQLLLERLQSIYDRVYKSTSARSFFLALY